MLNALRFAAAAALIIGGSVTLSHEAPERPGTSLMFGIYVFAHAVLEHSREKEGAK